MYFMIFVKGLFIIFVRIFLVLSVDNLFGVNFIILCNEVFVVYLVS